MPIEVICSCGKRLTAPDNMAGKRGRCPFCGNVIVMPAPQKAPEPRRYFTPAPAGAVNRISSVEPPSSFGRVVYRSGRGQSRRRVKQNLDQAPPETPPPKPPRVRGWFVPLPPRKPGDPEPHYDYAVRRPDGAIAPTTGWKRWVRNVSDD
jgi:hypothetical protein